MLLETARGDDDAVSPILELPLSELPLSETTTCASFRPFFSMMIVNTFFPPCYLP
jgi:hypothetical protein